MRIAKNAKEERIEYQKELVASIDFSPGAQEVIEWVDYRSPLVTGYTPTEIKTVLEFNSLISSGECETLQALHLNFGGRSEEGKGLDLTKLPLFKNLEILEVDDIARIPRELFELANLKVLICSFVDLDSIGDLVRLKNLEHLDLMFTHNILPASIGEMTKLRVLKLSSFSDDQPYTSIYKLQGLETFSTRYADDSQLNGISNLKNLKTLEVNRVTDEVAQLKSLTGLIITQSNSIDYPESLSNLENLVAFRLQGNFKIIEAPLFVAGLKKIEYITISGCAHLTSIPDSYNELANLKRFDIFYNASFTIKPANLGKIQSVVPRAITWLNGFIEPSNL